MGFHEFAMVPRKFAKVFTSSREFARVREVRESSHKFAKFAQVRDGFARVCGSSRRVRGRVRKSSREFATGSQEFATIQRTSSQGFARVRESLRRVCKSGTWFAVANPRTDFFTSVVVDGYRIMMVEEESGQTDFLRRWNGRNHL